MPRLEKSALSRLHLLVPLLWGFFLLACPRKVRRATLAPVPLPTTAEALLARLSADQLAYTTLALQYRATYLGERRQNFTLRLHTLKDSLIWLSGSFLSMEGVRGLIRPDSAFLVQKLEKTLYYTSLDTLRGLLPAAGLSDLMNLLLARWPTGLSGLDWKWNPETATLSALHQQAYLQAELAKNTLRLLGWQVRLPTGITFALGYEWDDAPVPSRITLALPTEDTLLLTLTSFQPHVPDLSFAFSFPDGYTRRPLLLR